MILAHAPAGYLVSKVMQARGISVRGLAAAGILGALAPDFDMFYFYLWDHRQHHHHTYWTHYPIVWGSLLLLSVLWLYLSGKTKASLLFFVFCLNGFLHLVLDSFVGDIWWFAPFIDKPYSLFTVEAKFTPWWLNFILNWSFLAEIMIIAGAFYIFFRSRKIKASVSPIGNEHHS